MDLDNSGRNDQQTSFFLLHFFPFYFKCHFSNVQHMIQNYNTEKTQMYGLKCSHFHTMTHCMTVEINNHNIHTPFTQAAFNHSNETYMYGIPWKWTWPHSNARTFLHLVFWTMLMSDLRVHVNQMQVNPSKWAIFSH